MTQSAPDKSVCPDKADNVTGPSPLPAQYGPTEASRETSADVCSRGVTTQSAVGPAVGSNPPPLCKLSGTIEPGRKVMLKLDQAPGAVLATFGDRTDSARVDGPYKHAGPFTHGIIEAFGNITNGKLPDDLVGEFPASGVNAMMQAMTAFEPTNELEGMIAAQAVALHHVTLDSLVRAQRCDRLDFRAQYVGMANKSARTFATLLEALNRHRGKTTTQRVIVENVTVEAGGQAVVGAVAGVGSSKKDGERAHEYTHEGAGGAQEGALVIALPCEDATGDAMSASSGERQETMPNARGRSRQRRTAGKSERTKARPAHRRRDRGASDDARPAEGVAQSNRMNGAV